MARTFNPVLAGLLLLVLVGPTVAAPLASFFGHQLALRGLSRWLLPKPVGQPSAALFTLDADKVKVDFYEESLCPYCAAFIRGELKDFVNSELIQITDLRIIPYGNAKLKPDGSIACQHGPLECTGNLIESCAIHHYPNVSVYYPFLECLAWAGLRIELEAPKCALKAGLNSALIEKCFHGPQGDKLVRKNGEETGALDPPHRYVPWLVVNGKPASENYDQVAALVCEAYTGTKPEACSGLTLKTRKRRFGKNRHARLHMGNAIQTT